jgi:predicted enzyme related to lactoylglutathione lyase
MNQDTNAINWFEIPVTDMARAKHFYQVAFGIHMQEENMMNIQMAYFPYNPGSGKVSGALAKSDFHVPSEHGAIIYLNAHPDLTEVLERIEKEGGKIVMPKTLINEQVGYMAFFVDTEGNRLALHSQH